MKDKLGSNAYLIKMRNNTTWLHWFTCLYFPVEPICVLSLPIVLVSAEDSVMSSKPVSPKRDVLNPGEDKTAFLERGGPYF